MTDCGNMAEWLVIAPELLSYLTVAIELFEFRKLGDPGAASRLALDCLVYSWYSLILLEMPTG